jgi:5'-3' exoribonuclease 1
MNQQRGRRFRSAKEAEALEEKARQKGETLPTEARFDSNCITPGTPFMCRLDKALRYFIQYKISTSKAWQHCKVILSGHQVLCPTALKNYFIIFINMLFIFYP